MATASERSGEKRDLVLEPVLFAQHREHIVFQRAGEFGGLVGLEMQRDVACVHESTPSASSMNLHHDLGGSTDQS
jgi:hypothetical protein